VSWTDGEPRAQRLTLFFDGEQLVAEARERAKFLVPRDAKPIRTAAALGGGTEEVYTSQALAEALPASAFGSDPPGTFSMIASRGATTTSRVVIQLAAPG
jgi:hypothetical protein